METIGSHSGCSCAPSKPPVAVLSGYFWFLQLLSGSERMPVADHSPCFPSDLSLAVVPENDLGLFRKLSRSFRVHFKRGTNAFSADRNGPDAADQSGLVPLPKRTAVVLTNHQTCAEFIGMLQMKRRRAMSGPGLG